MRLLLDTHVLLWSQGDRRRLGGALELLEDPGNDLYVSAVTAWEISIKYALGRLTLAEPPRTWVPTRMTAMGARSVAIDQAAAVAVVDLPPVHRDPFDRMLVVQCGQLGARLVTADRVFEGYLVDCVPLW